MKKHLLFTTLVISTLYLNAQSVTDIEGTVYNIVDIGGHTWMAENLKTATYNDGSPIEYVSDSAAWVNSTTGAYCWYNNDSATYAETYGKLYNWFTANTGKLCPIEWHVPDDDEWTTLINFLGGDSVAGGKLKETGTTHWSNPNTGATNETGFTALPGGSRYDKFNDGGRYGWWWSTTVFAGTYAYTRDIGYAASSINRNAYLKKSGRSVRCVKNLDTFISNGTNIEQVILYPNPVTENLYLKNIKNINTTIIIYDLQGNQILSTQTGSNTINTSDLKNGIYILRIIDSEGILIFTFIKQ